MVYKRVPGLHRKPERKKKKKDHLLQSLLTPASLQRLFRFSARITALNKETCVGTVYCFMETVPGNSGEKQSVAGKKKSQQRACREDGHPWAQRPSSQGLPWQGQRSEHSSVTVHLERDG